MRKTGWRPVTLPSGLTVNLEAILYVRPAWHENHEALAIRFVTQHSDHLVASLSDVKALKEALR